ncbi:tellurium resistance protein TerC [Ponticaulis sp.]|uniref:TerC family protein n=1 Tax=Ponticaulis sp. TaxID=2020902 RepID=UPI000B715621|nr:tellurium resistance protein TerC [Ponticaulis sp.]MAI89750.1 tellurium resistance protein TerC [Ponticaulis sp.]OUY00764.1 MAG: tellurium resistance protein TerC [Hyphomonadaceae bacterium TMED5]|tara:strand:- start:35129 stop:36010 length:882 start_codon:yes stop_codon:yes gene_type:complete
MAELFSLSGLSTLLVLVLLQAVLGFDNLLYISIESKRVGEEGGKASMVRRWGIGLAVLFRIVLLIVIVSLFSLLAEPLFSVPLPGIFEAEFNLQSLVTLFGGGFIIYTAVKEINHLLAVDHIEHTEGNKKKSVFQAITMIVTMNVVFSFDSILSAMAIANTRNEAGEVEYQVWIMAVAIILSGVAMILLADRVAEFLKKNRMYEVLGLFILFIVGTLLVSEGGHLAHMEVFGYEIHAIQKSTFYLVIFVLVVTDVISTKYQKRLWAQRAAEISSQGSELASAEAAEAHMSGKH